MLETREVTRVMLPTAFGPFQAHAFESSTGSVHLALMRGQASEEPVLTRLHSECLTGDALGSLRCDCGVQLRLALRMIAAAGSGVLVYTTGHEGRGIGLINKLRAYVEQDTGADTVDANLHLGLPVDARSYDDIPGILRELGVRSVRLLTNNPAKIDALRILGVAVEEVVALPTSPHTRNLGYLRTKRARLGHLDAAGDPLPTAEHRPPAVADLMGPVRPGAQRPYVVLKYAQTLDGRIATATGDAKWISSEAERVVSHGLRAACDAVLVGVDTVIQDDPQLTVRMVPGASPVRVVLDTTLRVPRDAKILADDAATIVITTEQASVTARQRLASRHVAVHVVEAGPEGVDVGAALAVLRTLGTESLLVEGGGKVITSLLRAQVVDRLVVGVAPTIIGAGTEAVGDLGVAQVIDGIRLHNRVTCLAGDDVLVAFDVERTATHVESESDQSSPVASNRAPRN
ncbi:MAG: GTP cyclohydrolase II [Acidimicrobiia bacterium]